MLRLSDKNLKERILGKCRRVNYILQLLILQNLLLKTRPKRDINETSIEDEKERKRNQKISENLEVYKQKFKEETAELLNSLDKRSNGQLDEEFNKALVELRDKMVAHWTWLYKQHVC
uniref:Uncharacterized protein n=1 Tax=Globodera pallida TaxID=36090 RepID=A0A183CBM5_GLOPA